MNDPNKILKVNSTSLVDLKAELIRKQQEFRKEKAAGGSKSALLAAKRAAHKKVSVFSKKNAGVQDRALRDFEEKAEEENAIDRSKSILEAKAKLYEKMSTGGGLDLPDDEEGGGRFMVDFQRKSVDNALHRRLEERQREEEEERKERNKLLEEEQQRREEQKREAQEERKELLEEVPDSSDPAEEWVDYTDSFGRSRRCLRKDLPALIKQDKSLISEDSDLVDSSRLSMKEKDLMSADMYREMLREKWEAEQQEMVDTQNTVHYSNVRFDEKRSHGVGFYDFAKDEESRQEQMKALDELRNQTLEARGRKEKIKEKRKAMMAARLAKVRQRKMINNPEAAEEETGDSEDEDFIGPSLSEAAKTPEPELLKRDEGLRENAPVREWDKGKTDTSTWLDQPHKNPEKNYIESRREDREFEFAPPQAYFDSGANTNKPSKPRFPPRRENKDLFSKLDAMSALDQNHSRKNSEFGPPSDYFTVPVKRTRMDPMASLERKVNPDRSVDDVINSGLSSIRSQVDGKHTPGPEGKVEVSNIPLPPEQGIKEESTTDTAHIPDYQQLFYPGQFSMPPPGFPHHGAQFVPQYPPSNFNYNMPPTAAPSHNLQPMNNAPTQQEPKAQSRGQHQQPLPPGTEPIKVLDLPQKYDSASSAQGQEALSKTSANDGNTNRKQSEEDETSVKLAPPVGGVISAAPMIYDRVGSRVGAPVKPRYERVHLHQVPLTLPAPPSVGNTPQYPSQEDVHQKHEKDSVRTWHKQYSDNQPKTKPNTANIPFPSPYVQSEAMKSELFDTSGFDPTKPPPNTKE